MKPGKIIYCLSDIMKVNLNDDSLNKSSQEEREVAEHLAEVIISICNRKRFEYEEEATLDIYYESLHVSHDRNTHKLLNRGSQILLNLINGVEGRI
jgi:hypothetical protein